MIYDVTFSNGEIETVEAVTKQAAVDAARTQRVARIFDKFMQRPETQHHVPDSH